MSRTGFPEFAREPHELWYVAHGTLEGKILISGLTDNVGNLAQSFNPEELHERLIE
jgi:hypothetical protein